MSATLAANAIDVSNERDAITTGFPMEIIKKINPDALHCGHFELAVTGKRELIPTCVGDVRLLGTADTRVPQALL
jgi:hypothetical protein